jgi:hypothetical protein
MSETHDMTADEYSEVVSEARDEFESLKKLYEGAIEVHGEDSEIAAGVVDEYEAAKDRLEYLTSVEGKRNEELISRLKQFRSHVEVNAKLASTKAGMASSYMLNLEDAMEIEEELDRRGADYPDWEVPSPV